MAASPSPLAVMSFSVRCSSTSCVRQYGHQSAERKNTSIVPFGPATVFSVWVRPF